MNDNLALDTISKLMDWDKAGRDGEEFALLKLMSQFKYDNYEGYEPGCRFFSNLIGWLKQFEELSDREIAYEFIKKHLIFFSRQEIIHLVHRLWPLIQRTIVNSVAREKNVPHWEVFSKYRKEFDTQLRQSLFVGLSDGAKMDIFRRDNEGRISNEQTLVAYEVSTEKWKNLLKELKKDIADNQLQGAAVFKHVFLIDDFTASGTTLIRQDEETLEWKGKVKGFLNALISARDDIYKSSAEREDILRGKCNIYIHHYVGTAFSQREVQRRVASLKDHLDQIKNEFRLDDPWNDSSPEFDFKISFGIVLDESIKISQEGHADFFKLITNHYDDSVETKISGCVKYGYKEGSLPLVFEHNTPNNSVGIIWAETINNASASTPMVPLFRRRTRHS